MFNPVAPFGYLLPNMYLFIADIQIQTRLFEVVGPGLVSTSPAFVMRSASHPAGPHGRLAQKKVNRAGGFDTICTAVCDCCVVWSLFHMFAVCIIDQH